MWESVSLSSRVGSIKKNLSFHVGSIKKYLAFCIGSDAKVLSFRLGSIKNWCQKLAFCVCYKNWHERQVFRVRYMEPMWFFIKPTQKALFHVDYL